MSEIVLIWWINAIRKHFWERFPISRVVIDFILLIHWNISSFWIYQLFLSVMCQPWCGVFSLSPFGICNFRSYFCGAKCFTKFPHRKLIWKTVLCSFISVVKSSIRISFIKNDYLRVDWKSFSFIDFFLKSLKSRAKLVDFLVWTDEFILLRNNLFLGVVMCHFSGCAL